MSTKKIQPVILAGGKGTRMEIPFPKALFSFDGQTMIEHVILALKGDKGCLAPIIAIGYEGEQIRNKLGPRYHYAEQKELTGTATAVMAALPFLSDEVPVMVLYADNPFVSTGSIRRMREAFFRDEPTMAFFSTDLTNFRGKRRAFKEFGRVKRGENKQVIGVVEFKNATPAEKKIREVTPGGNCFDTQWLRGALSQVKPRGKKKEYTLTQLTEIAVNQGLGVITVPISPKEAIGINSLDDAKWAGVI